MQNQVLQFKLTNNLVDNWVMINPTKQQLFVLPKEESQMFPGRSPHFTGIRPAGYTNDPLNESENRDNLVTQVPPPYASSFTETDYMGMAVYTVPFNIDPDFAVFKSYDVANNLETDLYEADGDTLRNVRGGIQMLRIPRDRFNTELTESADILANNNETVIPHYGKYLVSISPKYLECFVIDILEKQHFAVDNMSDNVNDDDPLNPYPANKRRTVYECDKTSFQETPWAFELNPLQAGRLTGSVVEVWNSSKTVLKQTKVIGENNLNISDADLSPQLVLHPDTFGYDAPDAEIVSGDILRIYPRETYFDQIVIDLSYEDAQLQVEQVMSFLLNDVVRDMKTGIIEVYDKNGFVVDGATGNFDGNITQRYQISQQGRYELRKKLKKNG